MTATAENNVLPMPIESVELFKPYRLQLASMKAENAKMVFDYDTKDGDKAARSYIAKLRKTKTPVNETHKAAKAASLEYGRKLDAEKNEIIGELDAMIAVHQARVDEVEERNKTRVANLEAKYTAIVAMGDTHCDLAILRDNMAVLQSLVINESYEEFREEAEIAKNAAIAKVQLAIEHGEKAEADRLELEKLRQAEADRKAKAEALAAEQAQKDRDEKIRQEAELKAKREADEKSQKEAREAQEKIEKAEADKKAADKRARDAEEQAERDRITAKAAAEQAAKDSARREQEAVDREKKRVADENAAKEAAEAKRRADQQHRQKIIDEAAAAIIEITSKNLDAYSIVNAIVDGNIPHITIKF